jgi:hypothetical protein
MRVRARIRIGEAQFLQADTIDLSSGGLSLTSTQPLNMGQECLIELGISVPEIATPPILRAGVRYCAQMRDGRYRVGMKFTFVSIEAAELLASVLT